MPDAEPKAPPFRWEVFRHWANFALIATGATLGVFHDPMWFAFTAAAEAGVLWVVPDLPAVRAAVSQKHRAKTLRQERAYYLNELWGLHPKPPPKSGWFKRLLFEEEEPDPDESIKDRSSPACRDYLEMREIARKLREMRAVPGVNLSQTDLDRLDLVINGYLRLLIAMRPLSAAMSRLDIPRLDREVRQLEQDLVQADPTLRPALLERLRIAKAQLERHPKLEAMLHLLRTRAVDMAHQLRHIHGQVLANPGQDVHAMLDEIAGQQEIMGDPLAQLSADQAVRELLEQGRKKEEAPKAPTAARAAARRERA